MLINMRLQRIGYLSFRDKVVFLSALRFLQAGIRSRVFSAVKTRRVSYAGTSVGNVTRITRELPFHVV